MNAASICWIRRISNNELELCFNVTSTRVQAMAFLQKNFPTFYRTLGYFDNIDISPKEIRVGDPSRVIPVNRSFLRSVFAVTRLYAYLVGLRLSRIAKGSNSTGTIAFHPQNAAPWYNIWIVVQLAGLKTISDASEADVVFVFEDDTYSSEPDIPASAKSTRKIVNNQINDISKSNVAKIFKNVFGYDLEIDPTVYTGRAIRKSEKNGTHDGIEIDCPIPASEVSSEYVYQRLVDSTFTEGQSEDIRVAYALGRVPVVYHKYKDVQDRFGTTYLHVDILDANDAFSAEENAKILQFCKEIKLDFGAIDVMRDKRDGRIYIVDVNKTCMPVLSLSFKDQIRVQTAIAQALSSGLQ